MKKFKSKELHLGKPLGQFTYECSKSKQEKPQKVCRKIPKQQLRQHEDWSIQQQFISCIVPTLGYFQQNFNIYLVRRRYLYNLDESIKLRKKPYSPLDLNHIVHNLFMGLVALNRLRPHGNISASNTLTDDGINFYFVDEKAIDKSIPQQTLQDLQTDDLHQFGILLYQFATLQTSLPSKVENHLRQPSHEENDTICKLYGNHFYLLLTLLLNPNSKDTFEDFFRNLYKTGELFPHQIRRQFLSDTFNEYEQNLIVQAQLPVGDHLMRQQHNSKGLRQSKIRSLLKEPGVATTEFQSFLKFNLDPRTNTVILLEQDTQSMQPQKISSLFRSDYSGKKAFEAEEKRLYTQKQHSIINKRRFSKDEESKRKGSVKSPPIIKFVESGNSKRHSSFDGGFSPVTPAFEINSRSGKSVSVYDTNPFADVLSSSDDANPFKIDDILEVSEKSEEEEASPIFPNPINSMMQAAKQRYLKEKRIQETQLIERVAEICHMDEFLALLKFFMGIKIVDQSDINLFVALTSPSHTSLKVAHVDKFVKRVLNKYQFVTAQCSYALRQILLCRVVSQLRISGDSIISLFPGCSNQNHSVPVLSFIKELQKVLVIQIKENIIDEILCSCLSSDINRKRVTLLSIANEVEQIEQLYKAFNEKIDYHIPLTNIEEYMEACLESNPTLTTSEIQCAYLIEKDVFRMNTPTFATMSGFIRNTRKVKTQIEEDQLSEEKISARELVTFSDSENESTGTKFPISQERESPRSVQESVTHQPWRMYMEETEESGQTRNAQFLGSMFRRTESIGAAKLKFSEVMQRSHKNR